MKKRGLSEVVTTLILVLLVLVAIAIVWVVISNLIRDKGDDIGASTFEVSMAVKTVEPSSTSGNVLVRVERNVGEGNLQGINIIMSDGINSETVRVDPIDEGEETTYDISKGGLGAITKVSIRPIGGSDGNEKIGEVVGERELSYDQSVKSLGGLIAWWKFENDAKDATGNGHDGTEQGGVSYVTGQVEQAADFDGSNSITNNILSETNTGDFSVVFWVKWNVMGSSRRIVSNRGGSGDVGWEVRSNLDGEVQTLLDFGIVGGVDRGADLVTATGLTTNQWYHIVSTIDRSGNIIIYVNGEEQGSPQVISDHNGQTLSTTSPFCMGDALTCISPPGSHMGQIDELAIFNRALTADEIKSIYELTK